MPRLSFGFCVPIFAAPGPNLFRTPGFTQVEAAAAMRLARLADDLGYDSLWVADHLMLGRDDAILEGWTMLSALAGATANARLGMIHQAHYFRNPGLAAKMGATLDQISGGRLIHFMDCGYMGREYTAFGLPWNDDLEQRVADLAEATSVILALWTENGPVDHDGPTYRLDGAVCAPKPIQRPHPPLWFGETAPGVLDLCAHLGQGWNSTPVSLTEWRRRVALLEGACERAGRATTEIEKSLETQILVAPDRAALRYTLAGLLDVAGGGQELPAEIQPFLARYAEDPALRAFVAGEREDLPRQLAEDWIVGTPDEVAARIAAYAEAGMDHLMGWFMDAPKEDGLRLFAEAVMPRFR